MVSWKIMDTKTLNTYFHNKVLILNIILTFIIVLLHSQPLNRIGISTDDNYPLVHGVGVFAQVGVPMFFFISAMLFYKSISAMSDIKLKLKKRLSTLAIPYILWNSLFVAIYWTMTHISFIASMMNMPPVSSDVAGIMLSIINSKYTVLWFVKDLIVFCLMSPVFYVMLKSKIIMVVSICGLVFLNMSYSMEYESIWHWLPVYLLGAYIGYNKLYMITPPENYQRKIAVGCTMIILGLYALAFLDDRRMFLFRFLSPVLVWVLYDCFPTKWTLTKFKEKKWMHGLFFIYCTHFFIINIFQKLIFKILPHNLLCINSIQLITPVLVFLLLVACINIISGNKIYRVLIGGR